MRRTSGARAAVVRAGGTLSRLVALTFDDGPSEWTAPVLDVLQGHDVRATFFVLGRAIDGWEDVLRRMVHERHEIGNHLYSHRHPRKLSSWRLRRELGRTGTRVVEAAGAEARLVRPPYGEAPERVAAVAGAMGLGPVVLWSVAAVDWNARESGPIVERVLEGVAPGAIVVLHDGIPPQNSGSPTREPTVCALRELLPALRDRGYRFVTVSELLAEAAR